MAEDFISKSTVPTVETPTGLKEESTNRFSIFSNLTKRRRFLVLAVLLILALGGGLMVRNYIVSSRQSDNHAQTMPLSASMQQSLDNMIATANTYDVGSVVWANSMGIAADYAAQNHACEQAQNIMQEIRAKAPSQTEILQAYEQEVTKQC